MCCVVVVVFAVVVFMCFGCDVLGLVVFGCCELVLGVVSGQKWGSENREKWSSGMGVLQN